MLTLPSRFPPVSLTLPDAVIFGPYRDVFGPLTSVRVHLANGYSLSLTHGGAVRAADTYLARAMAPRGIDIPQIGADDDPSCLPAATGDEVAAALQTLAALPTAPGAIPALTRAQVAARTDSRPADCGTCHQEGGYPVPHWPRSRACNSSFSSDITGTERLHRVHCTCDWCF